LRRTLRAAWGLALGAAFMAAWGLALLAAIPIAVGAAILAPIVWAAMWLWRLRDRG
jgi:hypothetical protein